MLQSLRILSVVVFMFCCWSCGESPTRKLIVGKWQAMEWLTQGKPSGNDVQSTSFVFDSTGNYTYTHAGNLEKGTYKVENDMLFTTPANEREIMVKIARLTQDSLVFDMSRGGAEETLTLVRK